MRSISLARDDDFDGWRAAARACALDGVSPDRLVWIVASAADDLFASAKAASPLPTRSDDPRGFSVPRPFLDLARVAIAHADPQRFALLYAMLVRVRATPGLMQDQADPALRRLERMAKEVRRDIHKMRAFLRFRAIGDGDAARFVAWYEPDHHIARMNGAFFVNRFAAMHWSILTPDVSLHWDGARLSDGPGATRADAPAGDPLEETWKTYYASIFNPARLKVSAMLKEMPRKYWKNMPETALVPSLIAGAQARESAMMTASRTGKGGNATQAWEALRAEAMGCTRCPLYRPATQTVFGEGALSAALMFIGEQPGDQEDLAGRPFVGPAGQVFDRALAQAGIDRARTYVTNAVKHFKYEQRGRRRIHSRPDGAEIDACRWWVQQERGLIRPAVTVALGATAARSMLGRPVTIGAARGMPHLLEDGSEGWVTVHPSYLLRLRDKGAAEAEFARFVADLDHVRRRVAAIGGTDGG